MGEKQTDQIPKFTSYLVLRSNLQYLLKHSSPLIFLKTARPPSSPAAIGSQAAVTHWSLAPLTYTESMSTVITFILSAEKPSPTSATRPSVVVIIAA